MRATSEQHSVAPVGEAAIASGGVGNEHAVLSTKPGTDTDRQRSLASVRLWGLALAAALGLLSLAYAPDRFRTITAFVRPRLVFSRVRASRAPPRILLIQS